MWTQIHTFIDNNPMKTKATVYMEKTCKLMCVGGGGGSVRAHACAHIHTQTIRTLAHNVMDNGQRSH